MIAEATLALPFFMFAIYTLLTIVQIAYTQARMTVALDSATKQLAEYTHIYFVAGMDEVATGKGGMSSNVANEVASFLQQLGEGLGNISEELGQFVDGAGKALQGDSLTALIQDGIGEVVAKQMMENNLRDGTEDSAEEFYRRNRVENVNMFGSKFLEAGEGSSGKDIFMRVNYDICVIQLLKLKYTFHLSHCAYAQAWAGEE